MIYDTLDAIETYLGLSPNLDRALHCLKDSYAALAEMPVGRRDIAGDEVYCMAQSVDYREEGLWEVHRRYIDIQINLTGGETVGYLPRAALPEWGEYNAASDIQLSKATAAFLPLALEPGRFTVFFPQDAHAPCLRADEIPRGRKLVFKVLAE